MMKKFLALLISIIFMLSTLSLFACDNPSSEEKDDKCANCVQFSEEIVYKERNKVMYIGRPCVKCGHVSDPIDSFDVDVVVSEDMSSSAITKAQQDNPDGDIVICLKKGFYEKVFIGSKDRAVYLVGETGTKARIVQINGDSNGATVDNIIFKSELSEEFSEIKFEEASGNRYWLDTVIKNCHFEGKAYINSAWKKGVVDNLTVENCTFKNIGSGWSEENKNWSNISAIFIDEVWGETLIKDCVFDGVDYSAIRLGRESTDGNFTIENCFFRDVRRSRPIEIYTTSTLADDPNALDILITLTINNCIFADGDLNMFRFTKSSKANVTTILTIGKNQWANIPTDSMVKSGRGTDPTYYNISEQSAYQGEIK